tara:strand:- start:550 stop:726 length:177 start_codon:yes stop_codon:yes gene_type:complete
MKVAELELDTSGTPYGISKGIDHIFRLLLRDLKADMLANRADITNYVITLERRPDETK